MIIIIANWKMNMRKEGIDPFLAGLRDGYNCKVVLAPSLPYLYYVGANNPNLDIRLAGQNCSEYIRGNYTGEVSAAMLNDVGCHYVIIGHSERRTKMDESDDAIKAKVVRAQEVGLEPILCVGEQQSERDAGNTKEVLERQLTAVDSGYKGIVAYEPVWAVGTGNVASKEDLLDAIKLIQKQLPEATIIYGGSVNENNAAEILKIDGISGLLVGGASLHIDSFNSIIDQAEAMM
jgi:triosephosphate isomerase